MMKNNFIAFSTQMLIGVFVLIFTIILFFGSPTTGRSSSFGLLEISYSCLIFLLFCMMYLFIGSKLEARQNRIKNLLSILPPIVLSLLLLTSTIFLEKGSSQELAHSIYDFVVFTFCYNFSYPFVTVFHMHGFVNAFITSLLPSAFLCLGMEINRKRFRALTEDL